jgi:hypothetical protein
MRAMARSTVRLNNPKKAMNHNPHLKAIFMEIVDNQLRVNDPPQTRATLERLLKQGISEEHARMYIGQAIAVEVWNVMTNNAIYDEERYLRNLEKLPQELW